MTSLELISRVQAVFYASDDYNVKDLFAVEAAIHERDVMRDAIRLAKQRGDVHSRSAAHAWHYLVAALDLDTGIPLVDLSATTKQETEK